MGCWQTVRATLQNAGEGGVGDLQWTRISGGIVIPLVISCYGKFTRVKYRLGKPSWLVDRLEPLGTT